MVVFAFSVRLLYVPDYSIKFLNRTLIPLRRVIIPLALRLEYIRHAYLSSESIYTNVAVTIITTVTTHIAIMSCTLPCLKQFLAMFESGMIGEYTDATYTGSGKGTRTDQSIALTSLTNDGKSRSQPANDMQLRPNEVQSDSVAEISADASSTLSDRSSAAIIRKTQKWEVRYDRW